MHAECLPFTSVPHSTRLFTDFLYQYPRVEPFLARFDSDPAGLRARQSALAYPPERQHAIAGILERQNGRWSEPAAPQVLNSIARLGAGATAVVTGQQIGLLGGPAFSLYKALTAVKLAAEITRAGVDCVPVFWLATEDHDFAEISYADVLGEGHRLCRLQLPSAAAPGVPVGGIAPGPAITGVVEELGRAIGRGPVLEMVERSYAPEATLGDAFARLTASLFGRFGLVLIDPSDPELHALAQPLYREALRRAGELDSALAQRGRDLEGHGYHQQVKVTEESTLLFIEEEGTRLPIHRGRGRFTVGERSYDAAAIEERLAAAPKQFSANVLLRPVVEDYLLPTLAYIGGPSEVAYFAQASVVYERLLGRVTPIVHRFSATLVEPRMKKMLERYGLGLADLFQGPDSLRELLAARGLPQELDRAFQDTRQSLDASLQNLLAQLQQLDPTLEEAGGRAASKMRYQLQRLHGRAARAQLRRSGELEGQAGRMLDALYPHKALQERTIAGVDWLARYGPELLDQLLAVIHTGCLDHHIIHL